MRLPSSIATALAVSLMISSCSAPSKPAPPLPGRDEALRNWPRFRGPLGSGVAVNAKPPSSWDGASGRGVVWKTAVPLPGKNSPVVWGDKVFVSGADATRREVYCFDAASGGLAWRCEVPTPDGHPSVEIDVTEDTGHAASTMATDGRFVCAVYADLVLACIEMSGAVRWTKSLGAADNSYGHATSLITHGGLLIVQVDVGSDAESGASSLIAFDTVSGREAWRTVRPVPCSWTTPVVVATGGRDEVVTAADPFVIAYDPATGRELWRVECLGGEVAPSPTYAEGVVYACQDGAFLTAIRAGPDGERDGSRVAWSTDELLPDTVSPLADGTRVWVVSHDTLVCYDARSGKLLYEKEFDVHYTSSPTLVGDRVYLTNAEGTTFVFSADNEFSLLDTSPLGEPVQASPAFVADRIYIRGAQNLYCLGPGE